MQGNTNAGCANKKSLANNVSGLAMLKSCLINEVWKHGPNCPGVETRIAAVLLLNLIADMMQMIKLIQCQAISKLKVK